MVPIISFKNIGGSLCCLLLLTKCVVVGAEVLANLSIVPKQVFSVGAEQVIRLRCCIDSSITPLAEALTVFQKPVADLRSSLATDS